MVTVGVRELRNGLSRHLAAVRGGATLIVTEHGHPIARIVPIDSDSVLERLVAEGRITRASSAKRPAPEPVAAGGPIGDLVAEQRR